MYIHHRCTSTINVYPHRCCPHKDILWHDIMGSKASITYIYVEAGTNQAMAEIKLIFLKAILKSKCAKKNKESKAKSCFNYSKNAAVIRTSLNFTQRIWNCWKKYYQSNENLNVTPRLGKGKATEINVDQYRTWWLKESSFYKPVKLVVYPMIYEVSNQVLQDRTVNNSINVSFSGVYSVTSL